MAEFDPTSHPHRRYNPLTEEYVLVSPHRAKRPWLGQVEPPQALSLPEYDPACYLCPGNQRIGGATNPVYSSTFTFQNDFAALAPAPVPSPPEPAHPLLATRAVHGLCDVLIFHPRHDLTLARLKPLDICTIIDEWVRVFIERSKENGIRYVQIFENKGAMMGCSNPHPHGQVWSMSDIPSIPAKELASLRRYALSDVAVSSAPKGPLGRPCLLCEYAHFEASGADDKRVVAKNDDWVALVPWWATWPFEVLLLPYRRHIASLLELSSDEKSNLAQILSEVTIRFDNLFSCSFAYSMGIHQAPLARESAEAKHECEDECDVAHLHFHFLPPLLRSATVRKFLVGFELMAESQRDLTPEQGAERLRGCPTTHYTAAGL
ncbi:galactose-1-phosphate uridylyltransferase, partial [Phellopilus nigrolimitatus]